MILGFANLPTCPLIVAVSATRVDAVKNPACDLHRKRGRGGGAGNRTPVPKHFRADIYMFVLSSFVRTKTLRSSPGTFISKASVRQDAFETIRL